MRILLTVLFVVTTLQTSAMAVDIACSTQTSWWPQASALREMQDIADSVPVSVEIFPPSEEDALAKWVIDHTGDGVSDLLIMSGAVPDTIYAPGNTQADDSLVELFLDDGNCVINTGDYIFYVVNGAGTNGTGGIQTVMDIPGIVMWDDNTAVEVTAEGREITPTLGNFPSDRPFHLDELEGDWFPELILAQNAAGTRADPVIVKNSVTGGRLGIFYQVADDLADIRGEVISEWINNWYLNVVDDPAIAGNPIPANEETDVFRDEVLSWRPGQFAATHNVYLGTNFADVNAADASVLVGDGVGESSLDVGRLEFSQTYYWRVDEVNGAPDFTVHPGKIWSFTTEPIAYPITEITATASSSFGGSSAELTIDGSGLTGDLHGVAASDMWISGGPPPATIEYAFDRAHRLHELWIWNSNQLIEAFVGFGAKDVVIEHSLDGENWTALEGVGPLAQATGTNGYAHNNTIDFGGATAQHVRITINSVHGIAPQTSLSEVRFYSIPTLATRPSPADGATGVAPDTTLSWGRNGREADRHEVYVGADADSLVSAGGNSDMSLDTLALDLQLGQGYAWRVDEVNDAMDPSTWEGTVWTFATADTILIDDMEGYADEEFKEIWATWVDGFDDPGNGSLVGNGASGSPETGTANSGRQSLPLHYDNSGASLSEATRTFASPMDWTLHGVKSLSVYFYGDSANSGGQLYVKIGDTKVDYDGPAVGILRPSWQLWNIDLSMAGNVGSVGSLTIGVEGAGAQGVLLIDDIQLHHDLLEVAISPDITGAGDAVQGVPNDGDWPAGEHPALSIDDDTGTKYLHFKGETEPTGIQVTPLNGATIVTGLTFTTANDAPARDPVTFELYGSNAGINGPYTLIASGDIVDFAQATAWPRFTKNETAITFANSVAYTHYQLLFPTVRNPGGANSMQIAEVELIGSVAP